MIRLSKHANIRNNNHEVFAKSIMPRNGRML